MVRIENLVSIAQAVGLRKPEPSDADVKRKRIDSGERPATEAHVSPKKPCPSPQGHDFEAPPRPRADSVTQLSHSLGESLDSCPTQPHASFLRMLKDAATQIGALNLRRVNRVGWPPGTIPEGSDLDTVRAEWEARLSASKLASKLEQSADAVARTYAAKADAAALCDEMTLLVADFLLKSGVCPSHLRCVSARSLTDDGVLVGHLFLVYCETGFPAARMENSKEVFDHFARNASHYVVVDLWRSQGKWKSFASGAGKKDFVAYVGEALVECDPSVNLSYFHVDQDSRHS